MHPALVVLASGVLGARAGLTPPPARLPVPPPRRSSACACCSCCRRPRRPASSRRCARRCRQSSTVSLLGGGFVGGGASLTVGLHACGMPGQCDARTRQPCYRAAAQAHYSGGPPLVRFSTPQPTEPCASFSSKQRAARQTLEREQGQRAEQRPVSATAHPTAPRPRCPIFPPNSVRGARQEPDREQGQRAERDPV